MCVAVKQTAALPAAWEQNKRGEKGCTGAKQNRACCMNGDEKQLHHEKRCCCFHPVLWAHTLSLSLTQSHLRSLAVCSYNYLTSSSPHLFGLLCCHFALLLALFICCSSSLLHLSHHSICFSLPLFIPFH